MPRTTPRGLIAACLALVLSACGSSTPEPFNETLPPGAEQRHATQLRPGDCLVSIPDDLIATLVPCGNPHAAEFAMIYVVPEGAWPGSAQAVRLAKSFCAPRMRVKPSRRNEVAVSALPPLEDEWPRHRTAYCVAAARHGQLVGRVLD
ncbi:hypothetical protein ACFFV7_27245 [Nonomuraea spiralis]|uniref:Septum formation-related domain-containing protein n=1 Tax=Nonomuraea spiralis TaxID=46182 RepID=A0ABV5ILJ7_9ACTN|nr:hypothetical protein [Nonomuraea spiralis]GGT39499.1 hypothetical protein GCM10010176_099450 [Nonomuraea spiralis]